MEDPTRLSIRCVEEVAELEALAAAFTAVWGLDPASGIASPDILRAVAHSGGYVAAAVDEAGTVVGGSMGFRGVYGGHPSLHSHVTGVIASWADAGVGRALKRHQRAWARDAALDCITWTFDPLVRRNAWFNLHVLGAEAVEYLIDFYGPLRDDINGDDATDRLLALWWVDGERAAHADLGSVTALDVDELPRPAALLAIDGDDQPVAQETTGADTLLVALPADIVDIRRRDRQLADRWRFAARDALAGSLAAGWSIGGMTAAREYVLHRSSSNERVEP